MKVSRLFSAFDWISLTVYVFSSDALLDTSKYTTKLADGAVVAWPTKFTEAARGHGKRDVEFTVRAQVLRPKTSSESAKEEL